MGHYHGVIFNLKVKHTAPPEIKSWIKALFHGEWKDNPGIQNSVGFRDTLPPDFDIGAWRFDLDIIHQLTNKVNPEYSTYVFTKIDEHADYTQYYSTASVKYDAPHLTHLFLTWLLPYLHADEGDILYRGCYEHEYIEKVMYYEKGTILKNHGVVYHSIDGDDITFPYEQAFFDDEDDDVMRCDILKIPRTERWSKVMEWTPAQYLPPLTMAEVTTRNTETFKNHPRLAHNLKEDLKPFQAWDEWSNSYVD